MKDDEVVRQRIQARISDILSQAPPWTDDKRDKIVGLLKEGRSFSRLDTRHFSDGEDSRRREELRPTRIYRHYDSCGCLLYIGISYDPAKRAYDHQSDSWWMRWSVRMDMSEQFYDDRAAALMAERSLIQSEKPVFNTVHALDRDKSIIRYLIEHERWNHLSVDARVNPEERKNLLQTLLRAQMFNEINYNKG